MKMIATGLLVLAAVVYVPARLYESMHPALGYLRALCEAAMIGGLADWFAVTALFRHPLGVPLAHTAIIPNNKERIADALGRFVEFNFLSSEVMAEKLAKVDFVKVATDWMSDPARSHGAVAKVAEFLPKLFALPGAEPLREFARQLHASALARVEPAQSAAELLTALAAPERCRALVDQVVSSAGGADLSEQTVRQHLAALCAALGAGPDGARWVEFAAATWLEMRADPAHPGREFLARWLHEQLVALKDSPQLPALTEAFAATPLAPAVLEPLAQTRWAQLGTQLRAETAGADSRFCAALQAAVTGLGKNIGSNPLIQFFLNGQIRKMLLSAVEQHRHFAATLITDTMRTWDAGTMSGRIEEEIGRDLQYIRINGTVIGGLIGMLIHAASTLVFH